MKISHMDEEHVCIPNAVQPTAWVDLSQAACCLTNLRVSVWSIAGLIAERPGGRWGGRGEGGEDLTAPGRGGFRRWGLRWCWQAGESWGDLKGKWRGVGAGAEKPERELRLPPLTPHTHTRTHSPTPGHLAVCRAVGRQIRIWEGEITSLLPPGRGCWSQGRRRAGQAGWGGVCVCFNLGRKMQPVHGRGQ